MVSPTTFPAQRRPGSGPFAEGGGDGSAVFEPFDNAFYFDPRYVTSVENGSIADPFKTWDSWIAILGNNEGTKVYFPGYAVTPGAAPITEAQQLVIEGVSPNQLGSYINDVIELAGNGNTFGTTFRYMSLEGINLNDSQAALNFEHCEVNDINVAAGTFSGSIHAINTAFLIGQNTPDAIVTADGGYITSWEASAFQLSNVTIGTPDLVSSGTLSINSEISHFRLVTFAPGSQIIFTAGPGQLYLDPASYRSFLDNAITLTNGSVVRDDGSFPIDAATYPGTPEAEIDWFANPRAYIEQTGPLDLVFLRAPLTREVVLIVDNQTSGEGFESFTWPVDCQFSGGLPPEQESGISVYKLEYEEQLGVYFVYVVLMNALPDGG